MICFLKLFSSWKKAELKSQRVVKGKKDKCWICGQERTNINDHLSRVHKMSADVVKVVKSRKRLETRQAVSAGSFATKARQRTSFHCPVPECQDKVVARLHNHLRATHGIKDNLIFKKLVRQAVPAIPLVQLPRCSEEDENYNDKMFGAGRALEELYWL